MNNPKTPTVPTLSAPTAPTLPDSRNGKSADLRKAEFLNAIRSAFNAWNDGKAEFSKAVEKAQKAFDRRTATLAGAVRAAKESGLFTDDELIAAFKAMAAELGYKPQSASAALVSAGLRQRAVRGDKGTKKGGADTTTEKGEEAPEPTPTPAPAPTPEISTDPMEFAAQLATKMGKKEAMKFLSVAFQSLAIA